MTASTHYWRASGRGRYVRCFAVTSATISTGEEGPPPSAAQGAPGREPASARSAGAAPAYLGGADRTGRARNETQCLWQRTWSSCTSRAAAPGGSRCRAVDGVSLECWSGGTIGIVGESGCGKTTLGRIISGLIEPTSGKVSIDPGGHGAATPPGRSQGVVQMVFQDPSESLDPHIRIAESVKEPILKGHGSSLPDRVDAALSAVGLDPKLGANYLTSCLAGSSSVPASRGPSPKPSVVVLDEAVSSLDAILRNEILRLLIQLHRESNLSYIFISHDMTAVLAVSDRVVVMYLGRIVESVGRDALERAASPTRTQCCSSRHGRGQVVQEICPSCWSGRAGNSQPLRSEGPAVGTQTGAHWRTINAVPRSRDWANTAPTTSLLVITPEN